MKDDKNTQNTGEIQLDDDTTSAPNTASGIDSDNTAEFDDVDFEEIEETDEEGKTLSPAQKIKKLREKLNIAIEEKQQYLNGWQKEKAEFINIRRRDEESKQEFMKFAVQGLLEELIPVLDSFDMAMSNKASWDAISPEWRAGVESIYGQFKGILTKNGVESFGVIGDKADPAKFHMIGTDSTDDKNKDDTVSAVLQKGYMYKDKVLRPAMVRVFQI